MSHAIQRVGNERGFVRCRSEVIDAIRALGWHGVVGNTDELLWTPEKKDQMVRTAPKLAKLMELPFDKTGPAAGALIGDERLGWLRSLPLQVRHDDLLLMHASPNDLWRAPMPDCPDAEVSELMVLARLELSFTDTSIGLMYGRWAAS